MLYFSIFSLIGGVIIALVRGTLYSLSILIFFPFMVFSMSKVFMQARKAAIAKGMAIKDLGGKTEEILSNIKVVISFAREKKELEKFRNSAENLRIRS